MVYFEPKSFGGACLLLSISILPLVFCVQQLSVAIKWQDDRSAVWLVLAMPSLMDQLLLSVQVMMAKWSDLVVVHNYKIMAPIQKVEFRAMMEVLHNLNLETMVRPIGAKMWWNDTEYAIERWLLTADPWEIVLCFDDGGVRMPRLWRRVLMFPWKQLMVSWTPETESLCLEFRYCSRAHVGAILKFIADVASKAGNATAVHEVNLTEVREALNERHQIQHRRSASVPEDDVDRLLNQREIRRRLVRTN